MLNNFFQNSVSNLNIQENYSFIQSKEYCKLSDPFQGAIAKYEQHLRVLLIQTRYPVDTNFHFQQKVKLMLREKSKASTQKRLLPKTISLQEH